MLKIGRLWRNENKVIVRIRDWIGSPAGSNLAQHQDRCRPPACASVT